LEHPQPKPNERLHTRAVPFFPSVVRKFLSKFLFILRLRLCLPFGFGEAFCRVITLGDRDCHFIVSFLDQESIKTVCDGMPSHLFFALCASEAMFLYK
jgi:hypothetical protein